MPFCRLWVVTTSAVAGPRAAQNPIEDELWHLPVRIAGKLQPHEADPADQHHGELAVRIKYGGRLAASRVGAFNSTVVVLAMHRSGSSFLTALLWHCGGVVGTQWEFDNGWVLLPDESNKKGYFERRDVVRINRDLLMTVGAQYNDRLYDFWQKNSYILANLNGLAAKNATSGAVVLIKDPRLCLTYQWWAPPLQGRNVVAVMIVRHPLHVAKSLRSRDGMRMWRGVALWEIHTINALRAASETNTTVTFVLMTRMMTNLHPELERLVAILRLLGVCGLSVRGSVESFYDEGLLHYQGASFDASSGIISYEQGRLFNLLSALCLRASAPIAEDWARVNAVAARGGGIARHLQLSERGRQLLAVESAAGLLPNAIVDIHARGAAAEWYPKARSP